MKCLSVFLLKVLECLRKNRNLLDDECHRIVFKREEIESVDPSTDVVLMQSCRQMVKLFCPNEEPSQIFFCLKNQKDNTDFDLRCRDVIMRRMIERTHDIILNPDLFKACIQDAQLYCPTQLNFKKEVERNGRVIECLKERLPEGKLTSACRMKIIQITKNSALNYKLDPILINKCKEDMQNLCNSVPMRDSEKGEMEECLKQQLDKGKIVNEECKIHVAQIMQMEQADIHADPLLYASCKIDDRKFCVDHLRGQHLRCLFDVLDTNPNGLEEECRSKLSERREMYKAAVK
ncbi:Golgi apparatus protein 1, partial [Armadillidium vulgare]